MTASVLEFRRQLPRPKPQPLPKAPQYGCTRCDSELFVLREDGTVWCGKCETLTGNLRCLLTR